MTDAGRGALADAYDLLLFDLDGVVYLGDHAVPGAPAAVTALRERGTPVCYVTNNASRSTAAVAALLTRLGVPAEAEEVLTSAQAAAQLLAVRLPGGAPVLVVGAPALADEVSAAGLTVVGGAAEKPVAVIQGYGPDVGWRQLAEAALAIGRGAYWMATNADRTLPSPEGPLPGNGALVAALATATDREPDVVVGKPSPELFATAVRRAGARRPLVIGDRLDTDIAGAVAAGYPSLLVLTGVASAADAWRAPESCRPTYVAEGLSELLAAYPEVTVYATGAACGGWTVESGADGWLLSGAGTPIDALRTLCAARWASGETGQDERIVPRGAPASHALAGLRLAG